MFGFLQSAKMYKLRSILAGHELDVRSVAAIDQHRVVSGSRDGTARVWDLRYPLDTVTENEVAYSTATGLFVNSVAVVEASGVQLVAVGGQDGVIYLAEPHASYKPRGEDFGSFQLIGHQGNVCALHFNGDLASASWDGTAKIWDLELCAVKYDLKGHNASVWDVKIVDAKKEIYLTCSADRSIRKWVKDKVVATYAAHSDVVRKLLVLPGNKFVLASNDCTLKVLDMELGRVLQTLSGHTSFIYDVALLGNGDLVSTAEDRLVRIWRNGKAQQAITLPCLSVWCAAALENDDIVVGGSDRNLYCFSAARDRQATQEAQERFLAAVRDSAISEQTLDDLKKTDLPGYERLERPGKEEGLTVMVKSPTGVIEAHQWSGGVWVKIGDVVSSAGLEKKTHNGQEYDYVFDVDVEDGKPPLKLPYNARENPRVAADRFLAENDLPPSYLEEVVQFIETNTAGATLGLEVQAQTEPEIAPQSNYAVLPERVHITFDEYKPEQLIKGFMKFNLAREEPTFSLQEVSKVESALTSLLSSQGLFLVKDIAPRIFKHWQPLEKLIAYDVLRVSIPRITTVDLLQSTDTAESLLKMILEGISEIDETQAVLLMMIGRVLCNLTKSVLFAQLFITIEAEMMFSGYFEDFAQQLAVAVKVLATLQSASTLKHFANALLATAAFVLNVSAYIVANSGLHNDKAIGAVYAFANEIGDDIVQNEEAAYRLCLALGNLGTLGKTAAVPSWVEKAKSYKGKRFEILFGDLNRMAN